jgi:hypothetical protein
MRTHVWMPFWRARMRQRCCRQSQRHGSIHGGVSLLVGAFIASVAAALGGQQRDEDEEAYLASDKA